jgi:hypothetical protein
LNSVRIEALAGLGFGCFRQRRGLIGARLVPFGNDCRQERRLDGLARRFLGVLGGEFGSGRGVRRGTRGQIGLLRGILGTRGSRKCKGGD